MTSDQIKELRRLAETCSKKDRSVDEAVKFCDASGPDEVLALLDHIEALEQDAARYNTLIATGNYSPSVWNGGWALRTSGKPATKAELDASADLLIAQQDKGKETV